MNLSIDYYNRINKNLNNQYVLKGDFIKDKGNKSSDGENQEELYEKYRALESLKEEINKQIEDIEKTSDERTKSKIESMKKRQEQKFYKEINSQNIDKNIKKLSQANKQLSFYQRFLDAFQRDINIDPGRLLGLTDGIFGMVMTLLIFGMALPEAEIANYTGFVQFTSSLAPTFGITVISFILLGSFWIYNHEFIKLNNLNMPYLWINIFYLICISFIPFTTSIVGNYSHFFLANVIFGLNILLTIIFFLWMFHYAHKRGFLDEYISEAEKKYVYHTLYMIMGVTVIVNLLDFNVNPNFIYLFLLVPIISIVRDIMFKVDGE